MKIILLLEMKNCYSIFFTYIYLSYDGTFFSKCVYKREQTKLLWKIFFEIKCKNLRLSDIMVNIEKCLLKPFQVIDISYVTKLQNAAFFCDPVCTIISIRWFFLPWFRTRFLTKSHVILDLNWKLRIYINNEGGC